MNRAALWFGGFGIRGIIVPVILLAALRVGPAWAHGSEKHESSAGKAPSRTGAAGAQAKETEAALARRVWFRPNLQASVPLDLGFRDEAGRRVRLQKYFGEKPVVLALVYYRCATMCIAVLESLTSGLQEVPLDAGKEFDVVVVSIDPRETPADAVLAKKESLRRYGRSGTEAGWHFLTGRQAEIQSLAHSIGFGYAYNDQSGEYAHPNGVLVLTPQGRISHLFPDIVYQPQDLRLSLVEASSGQVGSPVDRALLLGYGSNAATGQYALRLVSVAGLAGLLVTLALTPFLLKRRHRRSRMTEAPKEGSKAETDCASANSAVAFLESPKGNHENNH